MKEDDVDTEKKHPKILEMEILIKMKSHQHLV